VRGTLIAGTLVIATALSVASCQRSAPVDHPTAASHTMREDTPAAAQLADLKAVLDNPGTPADRRIQSAMEQPGNEGLALELVRTARELHRAGDDGNGFRNVLFYLDCRAGRKGELLIDGPYLKEYAHFVQQLVEEELAATTGGGLRTNYESLLLYLSAHPDDTALREQTLKLAMSCARVDDLPPRPADEGPSSRLGAHYEHQIWNRAQFAWSVLFRLEVLHDGMELTDAIEVLGEPTPHASGNVAWQVPTGFRQATHLQAELRDGRLHFPWLPGKIRRGKAAAAASRE
jgi:hypothetical protein